MAKSARHLELEQRIHELEKLLSEKQQTEKEAHPFADNFKAVFEAANVGKSVTLPDGTINVNKAFADMLGYSQEELESTTWQALTPADEIDRIQELTTPILKGKSDSIRFDKRYIHKNGSHIWVDLSVSAHRDSNGELLHFITTVVNITDRKQAEADLMKSESNLSALINGREESIWSIDKHYNFDILNDFFKADFLKAFGLELQSGMSALDILPSDLMAIWQPLYERAMAGEHVVFNFSAPLGEKLHSFETTLHPIYTDGQISGVSAISVDITDRKQAEDSLRQSEDRYRNIVDATPLGVFIYELANDGQLIFRDSNPAASTILGVDCSQFIGMSIEEAFPPLAETEIPDKYRIVASTGEIWQTEQISYKYEKIEGAYQVTAFQGALNRTIVLFQDITHRKQTEQALVENSANMTAIMENTQDSIWTINTSYEIVFVNSVFADSFLASFGVQLEPGVSLLGSLPEPLQPGWKERYDRALSGESFEVIDEIDVGTHSIFIEVSFNPITINDKIVGASLFGRDITDRIQAEKDRLSMEQQLLQTQKLESLGVLAGGIAHDFNNILMGILGYADLALSELDIFSPAREYVQGINDSSRKAADLVKQMLAYSGKGKFSLEPINLNNLIQDTVQMLTISISKNVVLKFNYSEAPGFLEGDPSQIRQIIMNMVINASEAIGKKSGVIALTTGTMYCDREYISGTGFEAQVTLREQIDEGMYLFLEVSDTGMGMGKTTLERLFEPFFTTKYTGRGLGLSAVLGIVRGHKGMIKIYTEKGRGTSFKVLFPLYGSESENSKTETSMEIDDTWQGKGTFLIADDEEAVRTVGKHMLKKLGFEVITAKDGKIAIDLFKKHADKIVGVLLDLTMPHKDGAQVFQEIRQINSKVKVILCSGYNEQDATQQFVGKGLAGFIQKPYVAKELVAKVREVFTVNDID